MRDQTTIIIVSQTLQRGDKDTNLSKMEQAIVSENSTRRDLFLFPENNISGGLWKDGEADYRNIAESIPEGPSCQQVIEFAKKFKTTICAGIIERENSDYFITHFLCNANGFIGHQRKLFPQNPLKKNFFTAGEKMCTFDLFGCRCAILACADFMFPETTIISGLAGISLIICPTDCYYTKEKDTMIKLLCAKSVGANAKVVAAFGHGTSQSIKTVLAGIAVDEDGNILVCETRPINQDKIVKVSLTLDTPKETWGGFKARYNLLLHHLLKYKERQYA